MLSMEPPIRRRVTALQADQIMREALFQEEVINLLVKYKYLETDIRIDANLIITIEPS